jgi:hydrogenase nickel incorporation protein HypA/HybF
MHELSIAEGLLRAVLRELERQPAEARLKSVRVVMGELHQIVPDYLEHAYRLLGEDTPAAGSLLRLETRPVSVRCRACGVTGPIRAPFFSCGACASTDIEVVAGKELFLDALELEFPDAPDQPSQPETLP